MPTYPVYYDVTATTELEQVVHTHRISWQSGWRKGFGELNPSPRSWIFTSVAVESSPHSYLFTSATGCTKVLHKTYPVYDAPLLISARRTKCWWGQCVLVVRAIFRICRNKRQPYHVYNVTSRKAGYSPVLGSISRKSSPGSYPEHRFFLINN